MLHCYTLKYILGTWDTQGAWRSAYANGHQDRHLSPLAFGIWRNGVSFGLDKEKVLRNLDAQLQLLSAGVKKQ